MTVHWIKYIRAIQLPQVLKFQHNLGAFFHAVVTEAQTNGVWARYTPGTVQGSNNLQVDIHSATVTGTTNTAIDDVSTDLPG